MTYPKRLVERETDRTIARVQLRFYLTIVHDDRTILEQPEHQFRLLATLPLLVPATGLSDGRSLPQVGRGYAAPATDEIHPIVVVLTAFHDVGRPIRQYALEAATHEVRSSRC